MDLVSSGFRLEKLQLKLFTVCDVAAGLEFKKSKMESLKFKLTFPDCVIVPLFL